MPTVPGLPVPLPPWVRVLIYLGEPALWYLINDLVEYRSKQDPRETLEWRRLVCEWTRATPAATIEDKAHCTFDIVNYTDDQIDTTWTNADFTGLETKFDEFWNVVKTWQGNEQTLTAYKWYRMRFAETMTDKHRFENSGPPVRVQAKTIAGGSAAISLPYQVSMSVTEKTGVPKHWGRFYIPNLTQACMTTDYGRFDASNCQQVANAAAELYEDIQDLGFKPVVPVTQTNKVLAGALLTVEKLQVDDIPDIQRRRRPRQPAVRQIGVPSP